MHRQLCAHSIKPLSMELQSEDGDGRGWRGHSAAASMELGSAG